MTARAGVIRSRLPTLAVMVTTAVCFALLVLVLLPVPDNTVTRHSVRQKQIALTQGGNRLDSFSAVVKTTESSILDLPPYEILSLRLDPAVEGDDEPSDVSDVSYLEEVVKLSPAPDLDVIEKTNDGMLPVVSNGGRKPWQVYARPFTATDKPKIAIVIAPLGADRAVTNAAIERLPGGVTLGFDAAMASREDALARARMAGHETMLVIPAEPFDFPNSDPGPNSLLTSLTPQENRRRLLSFLRQGTGYIGVMTLSGTRFVSTPKPLQNFLEEIQSRGLALLDTRLTERGGLAEQAQKIGLPLAAVDFRIHPEFSATMIDQTLAQAKAAAKQSGQVVCLVFATPLTIDRLNRWLRSFSGQVRLVPLSALMR